MGLEVVEVLPFDLRIGRQEFSEPVAAEMVERVSVHQNHMHAAVTT